MKRLQCSVHNSTLETFIQSKCRIICRFNRFKSGSDDTYMFSLSRNLVEKPKKLSTLIHTVKHIVFFTFIFLEDYKTLSLQSLKNLLFLKMWTNWEKCFVNFCWYFVCYFWIWRIIPSAYLYILLLFSIMYCKTGTRFLIVPQTLLFYMYRTVLMYILSGSWFEFNWSIFSKEII